MIVIDTCVMVDMAVTSRPRHARAAALHAKLQERQVPAEMPMHAFFELQHALKSELRAGGKLAKSVLTESRPLSFTPVAIDEAFVRTYLVALPDSFPPVRAGDLIFLALALGRKATLLTEDKELYGHAKAAGVDVCSIDEWLSR